MKKQLEVCQFSGHGHYKVGIIFRGKLVTCITNNMVAIDDYHSDFFEKDGREYKHKRGYNSLRNEIIRVNDLK